MPVSGGGNFYALGISYCALGQRSARTHSPHRGLCALQICLPWKMKRCSSGPQSSRGKSSIRSRSTPTGSFLGEAEPTHDPTDMGIDDDRFGLTEGITQDDISRLPPDSGELDQFGHRLGDLTAMLLYDLGRHPDQTSRLVPEEACRSDDLLDILLSGMGEILRRRIPLEELGGHHIDARICALR